MTTLELTEKQAKAFLLLMKANAWDIKSGSVELRFDEEGWPISARTTVFTRLYTGKFDDGFQIAV